MFFYLLLAFTFIPAAEIALFVRIGSVIGPFATFGVVVATGIAGAALARSQGVRVVKDINESLAQGRLPTDELAAGALILVGGTLLLTPGFMTDFFGLLCLAPISRHLLVALMKRWFRQRVEELKAGDTRVGGWDVHIGGVRPGPAARQPGHPAPRVHPQGPSRSRPDRGPRTIDASYSVVGEEPDEGAQESSLLEGAGNEEESTD